MGRFICLVLIAFLLAAVSSAPQGNPNEDVHVVRSVYKSDGFGTYTYTYELSNGQIVSERGYLKRIGDTQFVVVSGQYSYFGPNGQIYWVNYTADENGFHPVVGTGPEGGIKPGQDAVGIDPNTLKSLVG